MKLADLKMGEKALITEVSVTDVTLAQRLSDLGLKKDQTVVALEKSPSGGVNAYRLSNGVFALDCDISEKVSVEKASE